MTKRVKLRSRLPHWKGTGFEGWAQNWVRKNYWRVSNYFPDKQDALQECALLFYKVRAQYAASVKDPAHLMALYKTTVIRAWILYSGKDHLLKYPQPLAEKHILGQDYNYGELYYSLKNASAELRQVLQVLADAPTEALQVMFAQDTLAVMNRRILRMCGLRSRKNILKELRELCSSMAKD